MPGQPQCSVPSYDYRWDLMNYLGTLILAAVMIVILNMIVRIILKEKVRIMNRELDSNLKSLSPAMTNNLGIDWWLSERLQCLFFNAPQYSDWVFLNLKVYHYKAANLSFFGYDFMSIHIFIYISILKAIICTSLFTKHTAPFF